MNDFYAFSDSDRAIDFSRHDTPTPWINYLSNGRLHAFVSQAGGGLCWWKSPLIYRLTRYRMYNLPIDSPGFYIYIRTKDGVVWSPTFRPCETALDQWRSRHQPGQTTFYARKGDLQAELTLFVAPDHDVMVWDLKLTNLSERPVEADVFGYVELSLLGRNEEMNWGYYMKYQIKTWYDPQAAAVMYFYGHDNHPALKEIPLVYFAASRPAASFDGDRDKFVGPYHYERNPIAVERGHCSNSALEGGEPCGALQVPVTVAAGKQERLQFFLGTAPHALFEFSQAVKTAGEILTQLRSPGVVDQQHAKLETWWDQHLGAFQCQVPSADAQRLINLWNPVQCVHTGRYSRSISFYAPGIRGVGFRDTCQDMLAIAYRRPEWARDMLCFQLGQQYEDGHVVHAAFREENQPPWTTVHSDDHLWLHLLAYAVIAETGDLSILSQSVPYLAADSKAAGRDATIWEHLLSALNFTETHLGRHGIPLTLHSDWNDVIGKFARKGLGESIFAGQQYVYSLRLMIELAQAAGKDADERHLQQLLAKQTKALEACAWDGQWWRRGFDDDGTALGCSDSPFGKIWLNPQSWSVLCGIGTGPQLRAGMQAVSDNLDTEVGLKILTPSFKTWPEVPDPFSGYRPGCGENGAIFCHANTWAIIAEALLGNADRAWKYYTQLLPDVAARKVGIERYRGEPYAYSSNILGPENSNFGCSNVTQVSGTAAWMDIAATQYLLGIRPQVGGLRIDPCIPADWKSFGVRRLFRGCNLQISVTNPAGVSKGVRSIKLDGVALDISHGPLIPAAALAGKHSVRVEVEMG